MLIIGVRVIFSNIPNCHLYVTYNILLQLLAVFDDVPMLSQLENMILDSSYFDINLFDHISNETLGTNSQHDQASSSQTTYIRQSGTEDRAGGTGHHTQLPDNGHNFLVPKIFKCMYCDKQFYNKPAWRKHHVKHVKQLLRCQCCGRRCFNVSDLRRHYKYYHYYDPREVIMDHRWKLFAIV